MSVLLWNIGLYCQKWGWKRTIVAESTWSLPCWIKSCIWGQCRLIWVGTPLNLHYLLLWHIPTIGQQMVACQLIWVYTGCKGLIKVGSSLLTKPACYGLLKYNNILLYNNIHVSVNGKCNLVFWRLAYSGGKDMVLCETLFKLTFSFSLNKDVLLWVHMLKML